MITMPALLERTADLVRESLGQPVRLRRFLQEHPKIRINLEGVPPSIWMNDVFPWHQVADAFLLSNRPIGSLLGWKLHGDDYSSFLLQRPEFSVLTQSRWTPNFECDIRDVQGLAEADSGMSSYQDLDSWVRDQAPELVTPVTGAQLFSNLAHRQVRVSDSASTDRFCRFAWDGRLFLDNNGGARHFAAARHIAGQLGQSVPLRSQLIMHLINGAVAESLRKDFEIFLLPDPPVICNEFHEVMKSMGVTWLWHPLPTPYQECKAIYLPRSEERSMQVADLLRGFGMADLGRLLAMHVQRQWVHGNRS